LFWAIDGMESNNTVENIKGILNDMLQRKGIVLNIKPRTTERKIILI